MTLLNSKRIIKHYLEILTFAVFKKVKKNSLKKSKNGQKSTLFFKKVIFVTKIPNTLTFKVKTQKKISHVFSDFSHGITQ